jgi:hypothetical protein
MLRGVMLSALLTALTAPRLLLVDLLPNSQAHQANSHIRPKALGVLIELHELTNLSNLRRELQG